MREVVVTKKRGWRFLFMGVEKINLRLSSKVWANIGEHPVKF